MSALKVKFESPEQAVRFVELMNTCSYDVDIRHWSKTLDAKSLMGVLSLVNAGTLEVLFHQDEDCRLMREALADCAA